MVSVAVVSDVHANLEALDAVLAETRGLELYCLGDLVGWLPFGDRTLTRMMSCR